MNRYVIDVPNRHNLIRGRQQQLFNKHSANSFSLHSNSNNDKNSHSSLNNFDYRSTGMLKINPSQNIRQKLNGITMVRKN